MFLKSIKKLLPTIEIDVDVTVTQNYESNESKKEDYGELPPPNTRGKRKPMPKPNVS